MRKPFTSLKLFVWLFFAVVSSFMIAFPAGAQDSSQSEQKPKEESKVATVEVTPAQATAAIGSKLQFKAVAKDASGQVLPDKVKTWSAAPFDSAGADDNGEVSFVQPGEIIVGALIGKKRVTLMSPSANHTSP